MGYDYMAPLKEEYKKLIQEEKDGNVAKLIHETMKKFCDRTVDRCKETFCHLSTNNYKPIDSNEIFVLQLNIAIAKEIRTFIDNEIINGDNASASLVEIRRG